MGTSLVHFDFQSLKDGNWLTDGIMDAFLDIMMERLEEKVDVFVLPCNALQFMLMGVSSYITKMTASLAICKDFWIIPVFSDRDHWIIFFVMIKRQKIVILNSSQSEAELSTSTRKKKA